MKGTLRSLLKFAGKGERKVIAVFGSSPDGCHTAVQYVRTGAPGLPVLLFATAEPLPETASLCERVQVSRSAWALLFQAQRRLWPHWVAMGVAPWMGGRDGWLLKLAPFLIPPFHSLLLNENGDFFAGTPNKILLHSGRRVRERWQSVLDHGRAYWRLLRHDIWLSGPVTRVKDEIAGFALLLDLFFLRAAAAVLRWSHFSRQGWVDRLHGSQALRVWPEPGDGRRTACFRQEGPYWSGPKLEAFVNTEARWIVWQQDGGENRPIDDMLPLFDDQRTFAVSRQSHCRGWKPMLFPLAPFRTLQPGEASQVLAPLSGTVVVDRQKLRALGIPHCSLAGTAWMLLFWKAAAAGWRSYSVGQEQPLGEQPDFPMQETAFLRRFLADRGLRRLGPREPALAGGSIAFTPLHRRVCGSGRLRVLIVAPFLPYPLSHGGAVRMFNLCRALSGRVDFILVAMREARDVIDYDRLHEVFREVHVVDQDERASCDEGLPEQVRQHQSRALRTLVEELARERKPDLLQIEYTHFAQLRDAAPKAPAILVEHDLTFSLYRQLAEQQDAGPAARREYQRWLDFERHWLGSYDGVWTVSADDRLSAIREGRRSADRTFTVPNGVDIQRFVPREEPTACAEIFYVGSFRHLPNVLGFQKLREEVMPRVWSRFPETRLRVVAGPQYETFWNRFAPGAAQGAFDSRIEMHGFIEDLRPLYARASVVTVPLEVSAGTNIKVLEAMACGKAVVTTPIGCAGLDLEDRYDACIAADWPAFAASVAELLADAALRRQLGAHARRTAEERFSWDAIADGAYDSYRTLAARLDLSGTMPEPAASNTPPAIPASGRPVRARSMASSMDRPGSGSRSMARRRAGRVGFDK